MDNSESAAARVAELNLKLSLGGGTMTGDINLDNHRVKNSLEPINSKDLTTKNNVDTEIAKIPQGSGGGSLIQYVKRDGTMAMTGNLNLGNKQIVNLGSNINNNSDVVNLGFCNTKYLHKVSDTDLDLDNHRVKNSLEPINSKDLTTKNYVDTEIAKIPQGSSSSTQFVRRDGTLPMNANLNMSNNKVVNLNRPTDNGDATTKRYVDETITESSIIGSSTENKFAFLNNVSNAAAVRNIVIDSYDDFNDSLHSNKKAFNITLQINVGTNNYNSQMAFNLQSLPVGKYSMIFEFYPPQMTNVSISCQVAQLILHKQFKRGFSNYYQLLVQINNETELAKPIFLTMRGTSTSGLNAHVIAYGVSEWSDYVSSYVYGMISSNGGDTSSFLKLDGSRAMTGDLNINTNKIINLKTPTADGDAASKFYVDDKLEQSHLVASSVKNEFTFLYNTDHITLEYNVVSADFTTFESSPHENKRAFNLGLQKDAGTNNYRSRIGFNIQQLPLGKYTIIFEFFPTEMTNIQLSCQATSAYIHKQVQKDFTNYSKLLVQFNNNSKNSPDFIYLTMHGTSTDPAGANLILYGMTDWSDYIDPRLYDRVLTKQMFEFDTENMKMKTNIDMDRYKIKNLGDGSDDSDAVNKRQLETVKTQSDTTESRLFSLTNQFNTTKRQFEALKAQYETNLKYTNNYTYRRIFGVHFYDLKEVSTFKMAPKSYYRVVGGINPSLNFSTSSSTPEDKDITISKYDPIKGILFNDEVKVILDLGFGVDETFPYTIFVSMTLNDDFKISFTESDDEQINYYPIFSIDKTNRILKIESAGDVTKTTTYLQKFNDKQIMVHFYFDNSRNRYGISFSNESFVHYDVSPAPSFFDTRKVKITPGNNHINKICYMKSYLDSEDDELSLIFEEKRNGTLIV